MSQTYGSQLFGPLYDIFGWVLMAGLFFWLAINSENLTAAQRAKMPDFLLNRKFCLFIGCLLLFLGAGKAMRWW